MIKKRKLHKFVVLRISVAPSCEADDSSRNLYVKIGRGMRIRERVVRDYNLCSSLLQGMPLRSSSLLAPRPRSQPAVEIHDGGGIVVVPRVRPGRGRGRPSEEEQVAHGGEIHDAAMKAPVERNDT